MSFLHLNFALTILSRHIFALSRSNLVFPGADSALDEFLHKLRYLAQPNGTKQSSEARSFNRLGRREIWSFSPAVAPLYAILGVINYANKTETGGVEVEMICMTEENRYSTL